MLPIASPLPPAEQEAKPEYAFWRGDLVYAAVDLYNDEAGSVPESAPGALLAAAGTRGMVVNVGHPQQARDQVIYLVSFETGEGKDKTLGLPFGCLEDELTQEEAVSTVA